MKDETRPDRRPSNQHGLSAGREMVDLDVALKIDPHIGREIRALRKARGQTLIQLSKQAELSSGYLSQIERSISHPSIKALHSISRALGVTVSWFFPAETKDDTDWRGNVVRANARRKLYFESGITDELLSPNLERQIELLRCTFRPGSESGDKPYRHEGEEAGIIISGELDLWLEGQHIVLKEGDSFAFDSETPHRYANCTTTDTVVIWVITPPSY